MKYAVLILSLSMVCTGCTSLAAKRHALNQESTSADIRYQEVLDNLAMVYHDPSSLPVYCSIFAGTIVVTDSTQLLSQTTVGPKAVGAQVLTPQFTRQESGNWTLDPINTPEKLEAIRAACQWVLFGPEFVQSRDSAGVLLSPEQVCPCMLRCPSAPNLAVIRSRHFGVWDRLCHLPPPSTWLWAGRECDCPAGACYKSCCGKGCVCVLPQGTQALADFTLILQDIARVDINSPTLLCLQPLPSEFLFPTTQYSNNDTAAAGFTNPTRYVLADVFLDRCGHLAPDTPYVPWRVENVGSDAALRSQITAASSGLH